jgi:hypothetical protein
MPAREHGASSTTTQIGRPTAAVALALLLVPTLLVHGCFGLAPPTLAPETEDAAPPQAGTGAVDPPLAADATALVDSAAPDTSMGSAAPPGPVVPVGPVGLDDASAAVEASAPPPSNFAVRCPLLSNTCADPAAPICCATGVQGGFSYSCVASGCGGIAIRCASDADCAEGLTCCYGPTFASCTQPAACAPGHTLCDPNALVPCPTGGQCVQLVFNGVPVPFFACQ